MRYLVHSKNNWVFRLEFMAFGFKVAYIFSKQQLGSLTARLMILYKLLVRMYYIGDVLVRLVFTTGNVMILKIVLVTH
jgi:hypothetical protein